MNIDPNAPAFPMGIPAALPQHGAYTQTGMTIRTEIASRIMAGFAAEGDPSVTAETAAESAVYWADALIDELNK